MMDIKTAFEQAIAAAKNGDKRKARTILRDVIAQDPRNVNAWILFAQVAEKKEHAIQCLERALQIEPGNQATQQRLDKLKYQEVPEKTAVREQVMTVAKADTAKSEINNQQQQTASEGIPQQKKAGTKSTYNPPTNKKCPYCGEKIHASAMVCRFCDCDLSGNDQQKHEGFLITPKMAGIFLVLAILAFLGWQLWPAASFGGPPDDIVIAHWKDENITNFQIINKGKCQNVPAEAKAMGIEEIWIVGVSYTYNYTSLPAEHRSKPDTWAKADGKWWNGWYYFNLPASRCP